MTPHDPTATRRQGDDAILEALGEIKTAQAVMNTRLFGNPDGEGTEGRLPVLETRMNSHAKDIRSLQKRSWYQAGFGAALLALWEVLKGHLRG
jgi:hypothetical protein